MALLIRAWFPKKAATAMSIAATGSGIASLLGPMTVTRWVNAYGFSGSFFREAWLILALAGMVLLLVRDGRRHWHRKRQKSRHRRSLHRAAGQAGCPDRHRP